MFRAAVDGLMVRAPLPVTLAPSAISLPLSVIAPAAEALPIAALVVRVPAPLLSLSALIVIAPVMVAPTVPPAFNVMLLPAVSEISPDPVSTGPLKLILLLPPVAVSVIVPLPDPVMPPIPVIEPARAVIVTLPALMSVAVLVPVISPVRAVKVTAFVPALIIFTGAVVALVVVPVRVPVLPFPE